MPRFVVLTHDHPSLHWDLLLESGEVLRTWRLARPPDAGGGIPTEALGDHRRAYLRYEGPVSGGRGEVRRWDAGEYAIEAETPERLVIALRGNRLGGRAVLERSGRTLRWTFEARTASADRASVRE